MTEYEKEMFGEALRDCFAAIEDNSFAYLLGCLDGAQAVDEKLRQIEKEAK